MTRHLPAAVAAAFALAFAAAASAQTLTVLKSVAEAARFDPQRDTSHASGEVTALLTDSLTSFDADLKTIRPHLAQSWTISPDGKTYTFSLRKDVKFCSGRGMTAKDVVASFERWRDPATRSLTVVRIASVDKIRAIDDYTVEFVLSRPDNELLLQLSTHFAGIVDAQQAAELKNDFGVTAFNGVGPFCFESWAPRQQVVLKRHDAYRWGPPQFDNKGPAKLQRIVLKSVPEESTLAATLTSGSDAMLTSALADWAEEKVHKVPNIAWTESRFVGFSPTLWLRVTKAPLDDPKVRKALAMAIDRPQLAKAVWGRNAQPAWSFSAPGVRDYDASLDKLAPGFDKAGAAKLLDEAGWKPGSDGVRVKNGQKLQLLLYAQDLPQWRNTLGAVHGMWRDVGVDLQLRLWEPQVAFSKLVDPEWNLTLFNNIHISTGDSMNNFLSKNIGKSNRTGFSDPEVDKLVEEGRQTSSDAERARMYHDAQVKLLAMTPAIPLYNDQREINYTKARLKGVKGFGMYGIMMYKALDIELVP